MNHNGTNWTTACTAFAACAAAMLVCGCGGMQQARLDDRRPMPPPEGYEGKTIPVLVGEVTASIDQPDDVREAVCRYLRDQTEAAISRHGMFVLVDTNAPTDLLSDFGFAPTQAAGETVEPAAAFDVEVLRLEEVLGATVKVGVFSTQKKHALAKVKVTLRSLTGGGNLASVQEGTSSKGAWGVIASVDRDAMKGWEFDGSMAGLACAEAVRAGVEDLQKQARFRSKTLGAGIEDRLLRPRTERGMKNK